MSFGRPRVSMSRGRPRVGMSHGRPRVSMSRGRPRVGMSRGRPSRPAVDIKLIMHRLHTMDINAAIRKFSKTQHTIIFTRLYPQKVTIYAYIYVYLPTSMAYVVH